MPILVCSKFIFCVLYGINKFFDNLTKFIIAKSKAVFPLLSSSFICFCASLLFDSFNKKFTIYGLIDDTESKRGVVPLPLIKPIKSFGTI